MFLRQGLLGWWLALFLLLSGLPAWSDLQPPLKSKAGADSGPSDTNCHGDPLPEGAMARMGTLRLRAGEPVRGLTFSPDGKTAMKNHHENTKEESTKEERHEASGIGAFCVFFSCFRLSCFRDSRWRSTRRDRTIPDPCPPSRN
jgi:hypothetical protein